MRNTNNMLKSALTALALATASTAVLASDNNAASTESAASSDATSSSEANASKTDGQRFEAEVLIAVPRPIPPVEEDDPAARADLNHDGHHTMDDLVLLLTSWGVCPAVDAVCTADINRDGLVDSNDMIYLLRLINLEAAQAS